MMTTLIIITIIIITCYYKLEINFVYILDVTDMGKQVC
jgi:hypothetical protein